MDGPLFDIGPHRRLRWTAQSH